MARHPVGYNLIGRAQSNAAARVIDALEPDRVEPRLETLVLEFGFNRTKNVVPKIVFH